MPTEAADPRTQPSMGDVLEAAKRIRPWVTHTPLERSSRLSAAAKAEVRLKLDCLQPTGSFKIRGAFNRIIPLAAADPTARIIAASSGNHAIAVMTAARATGMPATVLVGRAIPASKLDHLRSLETDDVRVNVLDVGSDEAELIARVRAATTGETYVAPYNDRWVVAGQGTVGLEVALDWPTCDTVVVPVGGGGLISGIALVLKSIHPNCRVIGVQPMASPTIHGFLKTGSRAPLVIGATLADGVAGNLEPDSITWEMCKSLVDEVVLVDEMQIRRAIRWAVEVHHLVVEGSAALPIAALLGGVVPIGARVAAIVTGRFLDPAILGDLLAAP